MLPAEQLVEMGVGLKSALQGNLFQRIGKCNYPVFCFSKPDLIEIGDRRQIKGFPEQVDDVVFAEVEFLTKRVQGDLPVIVFFNILSQLFGHGTGGLWIE